MNYFKYRVQSGQLFIKIMPLKKKNYEMIYSGSQTIKI